jgi:hypothetical protein
MIDAVVGFDTATDGGLRRKKAQRWLKSDCPIVDRDGAARA